MSAGTCRGRRRGRYDTVLSGGSPAGGNYHPGISRLSFTQLRAFPASPNLYRRSPSKREVPDQGILSTH